MINKIVIKNFRAFYGLQEVTFKPGINVIWGVNGTGKTSFLNAILWGMGMDSRDHFDTNYIFNRARIEELEIGETMEVSVTVDLIYRGDNLQFKRSVVGKKTETSAIARVRELSEAFINGEVLAHPDLVAQDIFGRENRDLWFVNSDICNHGFTSLCAIDKCRSESFVEALNRELPSWVQHPYRRVFITSRNRFETDMGLSDCDAMDVYLCAWFLLSKHSKYARNIDFSILVDGIYMHIHQERIPSLNKVWKTFGQSIICWQERMTIDDLGWDIANVIEISHDRDWTKAIAKNI